MWAEVSQCEKSANITLGPPSFQSHIRFVILQTLGTGAASEFRGNDHDQVRISSGGMAMIKFVAALGAAALLALGAGTMTDPSSGCEMAVLNRDGQLIEIVVCDDGSSFEVAHGEYRQDGEK